MTRFRTLLLSACLAAALHGQQLKFDLSQVEAKASDTLDVSLNGATLQFAGKFLSSKDPDEAKVKKLIASLEGIYVRWFEFKKGKEYSAADLEGIRKQLHAPEWSRIVGWKSVEEDETAEIYMRMDNGKLSGVAIIAAEPKELTIVNIVGPVDLDALAELGGHWGIPKVTKSKQ